MEILVCVLTALIAASCLSVNLIVAYMFWQHLQNRDKDTAEYLEETPEEKEARCLAAEAQAKYEQGFINLMEFSGRAPKGE